MKDLILTDYKICSKCKIEKHKSYFYPHRKCPDGLYSQCKVCQSEAKLRHKRSKDGLILYMYIHQKDSAKMRNMNSPSYTFPEYKNWVFSQPNFDGLYNRWVDSGYDSDKIPSCDRLNPRESYTIDNIRLVTFLENKEANYAYAKMTRGKKVVQYYAISNLDGTYTKGKKVAEFVNLRRASESVTGVSSNGGSISRSARLFKENNKTIYKGFIWELIEEEE